MLNPNQPIRRQARRHLRIFVVYAEDKPGVLSRITSLFRRRAYNIDSLTAGHSDVPGVSRLTVVMQADDAEARLIEANLYKLVNVLRVEDVTYESAINRDLALIKVKVGAGQRAEVLQMIEVFRARVVDVATETIIVEITATNDKIESLVEILKPFGIVEMVRTGSIAMKRGAEVTVHPHFVQAIVPQEQS